MKHLVIVVGTLLLAPACVAQDEASGRSLVTASKAVKISLVEAVQKASKAFDGQVVGALLDIGRKEKPAMSYAVLVVREGKLWTVDVDAQTGAVGKPKATAEDDDDERGELGQLGEKGEAHRASAKPATGKGVDKTQLVQAISLDLEDTKAGGLPAGFRAAETAGKGKPATWRVEERVDAPSGKRVLSVATGNGGSTFNLVLSEAVLPADLALSVKIHANTGDEDQGGGLVWRAVDAGNYYLARWNPLEDNLRCYKVVGERRTMFQSVDLKADAKTWHHLAVTMQGNKATIAFDDQQLLEFTDDTFAQPGRIGVWTKADAASSFAELQARAK